MLLAESHPMLMMELCFAQSVDWLNCAVNHGNLLKPKFHEKSIYENERTTFGIFYHKMTFF